MDRIERIRKYEEMLERASDAALKLEEALDAYENIQEEVRQLEAYYTSKEWKDDFEADEKGLLPNGLKRGVLSEDGIDSLLERVGDLRERLAKKKKAPKSRSW